ncbi:MAG TPA: c-type cytochrome [Candidatus Angelobacter sp.]
MSWKYVVNSCCAALLFVILFAFRPASAQSQENISGQAIFAANCSACHGSDGRGGERAPNIATRREVVSRADADLIRAVQNGVPGTAMPAFGYMGAPKISAVVGYLRSLQGIGVAVKVPGDPHLGENLFYGKAECSKCHMVNGRGGFISSDLSGYGFGRSVEGVRSAILNPDRSMDRRSEALTVVADDQHRFTGLIRNEDNFSLILQTEDGSFHTFSKEKIMRVEYSGHSLMPNDYENKLSSKEIDDLVSYLLKTGTPERASNQKHDSDEE